MHHYGCADLAWSGNELRLGSKRGKLLATVEPDSQWSGMWRVRFKGKLTDMVNLSRAKDAAMALVVTDLNAGESGSKGSPVRYSEAAE